MVGMFAGAGSGSGRQCSRSGCALAAGVTLTYHYRRSQVWLDDLTVERDPHGYDLCELHAASLSAPQGWWIDDRRLARRNGDSLIA